MEKNVKDSAIDSILSQRNTSKQEIDIKIQELILEGFDLNDNMREFIYQTNGKRLNASSRWYTEFEIGIGVGQYEDIAELQETAKTKLFPIGFRSPYDIYIDKNLIFYLTDYLQIGYINGNLERTLDILNGNINWSMVNILEKPDS